MAPARLQPHPEPWRPGVQLAESSRRVKKSQLEDLSWKGHGPGSPDPGGDSVLSTCPSMLLSLRSQQRAAGLNHRGASVGNVRKGGLCPANPPSPGPVTWLWHPQEASVWSLRARV